MKIWDKIGHRLGGIRAESMTLANFEKTKSNGNLYDFLRIFNPSENNSYICGPVGAGKTHAATALAHDGGVVMKLYQISRFVRWGMKLDGLDEGDMINLFAGIDISSGGYYAAAPAVVVIDDLGSEKMTEFSEQILFEILDNRIMRGVNGLVMTSNLPLAGMARRLGSERITSRIAQLCRDAIFSLDGESDWRTRK